MKPDRRPPWGAVISLSATVMVAFGVILYGFSIFVTDAAAGSDFSKTVLSAGYGGSVVAGGLLAIPIGRRADRAGVRGITALGGMLGGCGMAVFALASQPWHVLVAWWFFLGPAGAMMFYEVSFIAVDQWFIAEQRGRALGAVTLIGGLAGIIFIPATEWLVSEFGWRTASWVLGALMMSTALATATFALGTVARPHGLQVTPTRDRGLFRKLLRDRRFVLHTAAMVLIFFAVQGIFAHRVAVFEEVGFDVTVVAWWAAAASALSLPGRWIAPVLAGRFGSVPVQVVATIVLVVGTAAMVDGSTPWQLASHFVLFGVAFGAFLPLRALTMAEWFSGGRYGATMGSQWTVVTLIGATGPAVVGAMRDAADDYSAAIILILMALASGTALLAAVTRLASPST
ncbi:MAG: MFS transporter [Acidimicrobiia bacterium]|nr:MFS transporter [Acidimicrobiia bacterium]